MKNSEYWRKRFELLEDALHNKGTEYFSDLAKAYEKAANNTVKEIEAWYHRYAVNEGITYAEAKKILSKSELKSFKIDIDEYIKKGKTLNYSKQFERELERVSTKWHVTRLEYLMIQIQQQIEELYSKESYGVSALMGEIYTEGYYKAAYETHRGLGFGWAITALDAARVEKVLAAPWTSDGVNFSERIWGKHRPELVQYMKRELTQTIIRGESPINLINNVTNKFAVKRGQALTLVSTESAFFAAASQSDCFNDLDIEKYEFVATLDMKTSDVCRRLDGKVFDMKDREVGVNCNPMHPRCRSTTCPYFDDEFTTNNMRAARSADGKTYYVPASMKYEEWYKTYVEGKPLKAVYPKGYKDNRVIGERISEEDLKSFVNKATANGIEIGVSHDRFTYGGFEHFRGNTKILNETLDGLIEAKTKYSGKIDKPIILKYETVKSKSGQVDVCAFALTRGRTITLNDHMFDDLNVSKEYSEAVKMRMFVKGTTYRNVLIHEYGHILENFDKNLYRRVIDVTEKEAYNIGKELGEYLDRNVSSYGALYNGGIYSEAVAELYSKLFSPTKRFAEDIFRKAGYRL